MDISTLTKTGNRECNEDSIGVIQGKDFLSLIVADGLGGQDHGEVASQIAVQTASELFNEADWNDKVFNDYFQNTNDRVLKRQKQEEKPQNMMTTVVMGCISGNMLHIAHSGDSRLYYFRHKKVKFRTIDHSVPQYLALSGEIKEKDIRNHPDRSRLLKAVGQSAGKDFYEVDKPIKTRSGDAILLCSDGFWEYVDENEMSRCLKSASSSDEWLKMMEDIALDRGKESSMDNYSAIAVRF